MAIASAIVGGLIAGAGAIGAAKIGSNATKNAANATAQAADRSADVIEQNYNKSAAALAPWQQQGLQANAMINSALGLAPTQPAQSYGTPQASYQPNALMNPAYGQDYGRGMWNDYSQLSPNSLGDMTNGGWVPGPITGYGGGTFNPDGTQVTPGTVNTTVNPQSALDTYLNSTGYKFQLGEGLKAVNSGWAGRGLLQSGAALKSLNNYGQGMAQQGFGNWLGALGNQQDTGFRAASAQAGVSQGLGNSLASIYQNQGANAANAALIGGQNSAQLVNSLATIGAGIFGKQG